MPIVALDTLVTVVDGQKFLQDYFESGLVGSDAKLVEVEGASKFDRRHVIDLLVEQVEVADVIIINKTDLISDSDLETLRGILTMLNSQAVQVTCAFGAVDISKILATGLFAKHTFALQQDAGSAGVITSEKQLSRSYASSLSGSQGAGSFVFRSDRPFHPLRLHNLIVRWRTRNIWRSKGFLWISTRASKSAYWAHAGNHLRLQDGEDWSVNSTTGALERKTEIVFIGTNLVQPAIESALEECLLTPDEFDLGESGWKSFPDPIHLLPRDGWRVQRQFEYQIHFRWIIIALALAWFTIIYNLAEGAVSIGFGVSEESISVLSFGVDSLVEVSSACFVLWRLYGERKQLRAQVAQGSSISVKTARASFKERISTISIGLLLVGLAVGTLVGSSIKLRNREIPDTALPGILISSISLSFMFFLWYFKVKASILLNSATLEADAACSFSCISLSIILLIGSALFRISHSLWWTDSVTALLIALLIGYEGIENIRAATRDDFTGCGCTHKRSFLGRYMQRTLLTRDGTPKEAMARAYVTLSDGKFTQSGGLPSPQDLDQSSCPDIDAVQKAFLEEQTRKEAEQGSKKCESTQNSPAATSLAPAGG